MSLPAVNAVRARFPEAEITVLARAWVAELYAREPAIDRVMVYPAGSGLRGWKAKLSLIRKLRAQRFDCAILFQNAFEAALAAAAAGIPRRIGYSRDGRGWLLSDAVALPRPGEMPRHERFYYLELLRRTGILEALPQAAEIRLARAEEARERGAARFRELGLAAPVIGVSPGAAFGSAKRWLPSGWRDGTARLQSSAQQPSGRWPRRWPAACGQRVARCTIFRAPPRFPNLSTWRPARARCSPTIPAPCTSPRRSGCRRPPSSGPPMTPPPGRRGRAPAWSGGKWSAVPACCASVPSITGAWSG